jgi:hypothetical protein
MIIMNKNNWKYLIDTLLFICIFGLAFIGILMAFFLAEGPTVNDQSKYFLGLHRHQWGDIHLILSLAFIGLTVIHLILAWNWVKAQARRMFKNKAPLIISLTLLVSILTIFIFWAFMPKNSPVYSNYGRRSGEFGRIGITEKTPQAATPDPYPSASKQQNTKTQKPKKTKEKNLESRSVLPPQEDPSEHDTKIVHGRLEEEASGIIITGQMCLKDIEKKTGISTQTIIQALGLPANVSELDHLGRLRKKYGFSIQELRDFIEAEMEKSKKIK